MQKSKYLCIAKKIKKQKERARLLIKHNSLVSKYCTRTTY